MMFFANILAQCPCSGGGDSASSGVSQFAVMALLTLAACLWHVVKWTRSSWTVQGVSTMRRLGKIGLIVALGVTFAAVAGTQLLGQQAASGPATTAPTTQSSGIPKLMDLGSTTCEPCKLMAPILEELKKDFAGTFDVEFVDVGLKENLPQGQQYRVELIPTQIFFDKDGQEIWRHTGFMSRQDILGHWKELGYDFGGGTELPKIERWEPAKKDQRPKAQVCYMCEGDIDAKTAVVVKTDKGDVRLCSPHCYFIMFSCLTESKTGFEKKVSVSDYADGSLLPVNQAVYLRGMEEKTGRPWVKAFAARDAAIKAMHSTGGSIITWAALRQDELSHRCGFCDRSCYPQDAAEVLIEGVQSYGCCAHCAMGVAARTGKNIEVRQPDGLTGQVIVVKTAGGEIASIEPDTAVAWFGKRKAADGQWVSAGCFHQGFFTTPQNLEKWLEQLPYETGQIITINQSLVDKMKLNPQQIQKACKIGECAPK